MKAAWALFGAATTDHVLIDLGGADR